MFGPTVRNNLRERIRRALGGAAPLVQAAALPWRRNGGKIEVLLVTSRGTGRWILPKGWPEPGENLGDAASREAREEAGITGRMAAQACGTFLTNKFLPTGMAERCEVHVFPLQVEMEKTSWPEKDARVRRWVSPKRAARMVAEPDLAELIAQFGDNPREIAA